MLLFMATAAAVAAPFESFFAALFEDFLAAPLVGPFAAPFGKLPTLPFTEYSDLLTGSVLTRPFRATSIGTIRDAPVPLEEGGAPILALSDPGDGEEADAHLMPSSGSKTPDFLAGFCTWFEELLRNNLSGNNKLGPRSPILSFTSVLLLLLFWLWSRLEHDDAMVALGVEREDLN